jgi:archaellum component FlaC
LAVPIRDGQGDVVAFVEVIPSVTSLIDKAVERMDRLSDEINHVTTHSEKQARPAREMFDMAERLEADIDAA